MKGSSFGYLIRIGVKSVFRNRLMSFAAIGVLMACMILIGSAMLLSLNVNNLVEYTEEQNEITVFCNDDLDEQALANLDMDLNKLDNVIEVKFYSREEAFDSFKEKMDDDSLYEELTADIYPDAYILRVDDLSHLTETINQIKEAEGVQKVIAPTDIAEIVVEIKQAVYISGIGIVSILAVVALIIIANTIKITVFNRRKEINIMKFVGATDSFIRLPFVVEGMVLGIIAASLAFLFVWGGYTYLLTWMEGNQSPLFDMFGSQILPFESVGLTMLASFATGGVSIGVIGSMIFVRRYLRV